MKYFGNKKEVAIEYELKEDTWGYLNFWVNGYNICKYNEKLSYEGNLYYIVDWLCTKLEYYLGYDAFPLPVKGDTSLELIDSANKYENENFLEEELWYTSKRRWVLNHCWFVARGDGILPCINLRRKDLFLEISWDNMFWKEKGIIFDSMRNVYLTDLMGFINLLYQFLSSIIDDLEKNAGEDQVQELRRQLIIFDI